MGPGARLVLIDHLAAADPADDADGGSGGRWGGLMDLYMMSLFDGGAGSAPGRRTPTCWSGRASRPCG